MYSKAFDRKYGITDKTSKDHHWQSRKPLILARLSALNGEFGQAAGKHRENGQRTAYFCPLDELEITVFHTFEAVEKQWLAFENEAACFVYQRYSFCRIWYETVGKKYDESLHIVTIRDQTGQMLMLAPLCVGKGRFGTVLSFAGEGISDYLGPLIQDDFAASLEHSGFDLLWQRILAAIEPEIDLVWFDRQPRNIVGIGNPFCQLPGFAFPSNSHALDFPAAADWYHSVRKLRSNKTAKKIERRIRALGKVGKVELLEITGKDARSKHMQDLLALKIKNLNDAHILHRMDKPDVANFYHALVENADRGENICQFELRCGSKLVASVLGFVHHDIFYYQICAFNKKEFGQYSPGLLLLYQLFDWSFSNGLKRFDMTIGDEPYKADWANETTGIVTIGQPLSLSGRIDYMRRRGFLWLKEQVKSSKTLRGVVTRLLKT